MQSDEEPCVYSSIWSLSSYLLVIWVCVLEAAWCREANCIFTNFTNVTWANIKATGILKDQAIASWPVNKVWTTLGGCCLTPDWEVALSAQLTLTLHSSPAAGQLKPSLRKKLHCLHEVCCRYRYAQPATFYLNKLHVSVQDTELVPVNIPCRLARPVAVLALGWRVSMGSLWCHWGL